MSRETQRKGDLAKAQAIAYFTSLNWEVAVLLTESAPYDLIVDTGIELKRVQVKYTSTGSVDMRRIHSNSSGYVVRSYENTDFDWLLIYSSDNEIYLIDWSESPSNRFYLNNIAHLRKRGRVDEGANLEN